MEMEIAGVADPLDDSRQADVSGPTYQRLQGLQGDAAAGG